MQKWTSEVVAGPALGEVALGEVALGDATVLRPVIRVISI